MKTLLFIACYVLISPLIFGQNITFSFEGDSTTLPFVRDSLRGISGLEIVHSTGDWHFVSDRGWYYVFTNVRSINDLSDGSRIKIAQKTPFWFESIRYNTQDSTYFWTDEHEFVTSLHYAKRVDVNPCQLLLKIPLPSPNKGLEGIAITPSGALWVAPEAGWEGQTQLNQDTITFLRYPNPTAADAVAERYKYPIDRCAYAQGEEKLGGISEILSVDEQRLLVLERCYDVKQKRVIAKLYVGIQDTITKSLQKQLAFDFNSQFPGVICNLEAMAWADSRKQTLVLIADDNFRRQGTLRNQVIMLRRQTN